MILVSSPPTLAPPQLGYLTFVLLYQLQVDIDLLLRQAHCLYHLLVAHLAIVSYHAHGQGGFG